MEIRIAENVSKLQDKLRIFNCSARGESKIVPGMKVNMTRQRRKTSSYHDTAFRCLQECRAESKAGVGYLN